MWLWIIGALGTLLSFFYNRKKESGAESKYAEVKKENLEMRAENESLKKREQQRRDWEKAKEEWKELGEDEKLDRILDRFRDPD
jgi:Flp pilus assembly protein TadB